MSKADHREPTHSALAKTPQYERFRRGYCEPGEHRPPIVFGDAVARALEETRPELFSAAEPISAQTEPEEL